MADFAVIFDMDGVIIDNTDYHEISWKVFFERKGLNLSTEEFKKVVLGRTGKEALKIYFSGISDEQIKVYSDEINAIYRDEYAAFIKPAAGLVAFLEMLKAANIPTVVATSAPPINVKFVMESLGIRKYFDEIIDDTMVSKGKPDPEVYLKAAAAVNFNPSNCIVFEDSLSGIKAAGNAGTKVVGVATTHDESELKNVDLVVSNFESITPDNLKALFN